MDNQSSLIIENQNKNIPNTGLDATESNSGAKPKAGFWLRAAGVVIDDGIWNSFNMILLLVIGNSIISDGFQVVRDVTSVILFLLIFNCVKIVIQPFIISKAGGSLGKLAIGLKVVKDNGSNLSYFQAFFREYIEKILSTLVFGVGYYWINRNPEKKAWHDMSAQTYVSKESSTPVRTVILLLVVTAVQVGLLIFFVTSIVMGVLNKINF